MDIPEAGKLAVDPQSRLMITPTEVLEYLFCPRFTYFLNVLRIDQNEDKRFKVRKGREIHESRLKHNIKYLRKKIPVLKKEQDVYLADPDLGVRGIVDEILFLKGGTLIPVDYKFTPYRERAFLSHTIQITLYGLLVEKIYEKPVTAGYIAYIRGGSKTCEIEFTDALKRKAMSIVGEVLSIITKETIPKRTKFRGRCMDCCYKNICV